MRKSGLICPPGGCLLLLLSTSLVAACEPRLRAEPQVAAPGNTPPLPDGWRGSGILASRGSLPSGVPDWGTVQAEVVEHDSKRFLRTTGLANDVTTPALGHTTAENRARAEMSHWLGTSTVQGGMVINSWQSTNHRTYLSQVEVVLPPGTLFAPQQPATK